jgi:Phage tail protein
MPTITFGGLSFADDEPESGFAVARLMGWYDGAPVRSNVRDRPQADGAFGVDRYFRDARVISVEGDWVGSSMAEAYAAREALATIHSNGAPSSFEVSDELGVRSCEVTLAKEPTVDDVLRSPFFSWSFDVVARDPRKYAASIVASTGLPSTSGGLAFPIVFPIDFATTGTTGRIAVANDGLYETVSNFEVTGGLSGGFELTNVETGARLRFEREIPDGSTVYLNPRTGRVYLDSTDNDVSSFLTVREWWSIQPGTAHEIQLAAIGSVLGGTPTLTARTRSAY